MRMGIWLFGYLVICLFGDLVIWGAQAWHLLSLKFGLK